jgi:hypothetical protein
MSQMPAIFWYQLVLDSYEFKHELSFNRVDSNVHLWIFDPLDDLSDSTWGYVLHGPSPA